MGANAHHLITDALPCQAPPYRSMPSPALPCHAMILQVHGIFIRPYADDLVILKQKILK